MGKVIRKRESWDQPCCEKCWIRNESRKEVGDDPEAMVVVQIRKPIMVDQQYTSIERCRWCNEPTFVGIYVRFDPLKVPFPEEADVKETQTPKIVGPGGGPVN